MIQILGMFCKKDIFVDLKIYNQSYLLPKIHFNAQLILGLKLASVFEDQNNIIANVANSSVEQFVLGVKSSSQSSRLFGN